MVVARHVKKAAVYLVKDLARVTGCSVYTVEFYLRERLLKEIGRSPATNYRYFDEGTVAQLSAIKALRVQGLTLAQIRRRLKEPLT